MRIDAEHVVPRSRSGPHLVVLQQVRINKHAQLLGVAEGRNATIGFGNLFPHLAVHDFPKEVRVAIVARVFLDHVEEDPAQSQLIAANRQSLGELVDASRNKQLVDGSS